MVATNSGSVAHAGGKSAPAKQGAPAQVSREQILNQVLRLHASEIITLDVDSTPARAVRTPIAIEGNQYTIDLEPYSIRAPGYQLRAQLADGSIVEVDPGPVRTLRGSLEGVPGSQMAATLLDDGLHGSVILPDGTRWWIEPILNRIPGAAINEYVLYRGEDVIPSEGRCGTENDAALLPDLAAGGDDGGIAGSTVFCTELACDADFEYYLAYGSSVVNVQNRINQVINQMDLQYINEVDIDHIITNIIVRTAEPDPYTSAVANTLLNQFTNEWNVNQGAIPRDVAHLFTGKNMSAASGGTIGIAWLSGICNNQGYSVVQSDCCGSLGCATDLSAHELGHNWSAQHCSGACSSTMNSGLTCANTFTNSNPDSIAQIVAFRNSRTCLSTCADAVLPFFDDFPITTIDTAKWTTVVNCFSTNLGQNEPSPPNSLDLRGLASGGSQARTARMNTASVTNLQVSYQYQQQGNGNDPEPGDNLVVEYFNNVGNWVVAATHLGSDPVLATYTPVTLNLPADAKHSEFRLRFRNTATQTGQDNWFVDDVSIIASPTNDNCSTASIITNGTSAFTTIAASTDGPDETGGCGVGQLNNDVWYRYLPTCVPGTVTISLCGATFDSRLAVYVGCPGAPGALVCNDNFCGDDAQISLHVTVAQLLRIRVGGATAATGTGNMVITCVADPPSCPADVTGNGMVDIDDLLAVINGWGGGAGPADVTGNGVVDIDDLLAVINSWGTVC
jgi:hypothetical protein